MAPLELSNNDNAVSISFLTTPVKSCIKGPRDDSSTMRTYPSYCDEISESSGQIDVEDSGSRYLGKKRVRFGTISMREHEITLGDNPCCSNGPSVSLGWRYNKIGPFSVEAYENSMEGSRRTRMQLVIPRCHRESMLVDNGFGRTAIEKSIKEKEKIQKDRRASRKDSPLTKFGSAVANAKSKLSKIGSRRNLNDLV